jgi:predicted amidohydrolase
MKIAACQVPEIRENLNAALTWIERFAAQAAIAGAQLVCFPECFLQGYLVEEASARSHAIDLKSSAFKNIVERLAGFKPALVFGLIEINNGVLFNSAVVIEGGQLVGVYRKINLLAGESIFWPGDSYPIFNVGTLKFGINICSDTQIPNGAAAIAAQGARLIVCPANNMMRRENAEKWKYRHNETRALRVRETGLWLISSDVTGTRGDSVALGPTCVIDPQGNVVSQVPLLEVGMITVEIA